MLQRKKDNKKYFFIYMTKFLECYGNFFGFLFFLRFAHMDIAFVVNYNGGPESKMPRRHLRG